ncbi:MAG: hypothetical protein K0S08_438 [Gammaproteobacteria bacterium]|jgi:hypothetical protein|nr:hypothetical protein [Gammaproteobacteria bacterium]
MHKLFNKTLAVGIAFTIVIAGCTSTKSQTAAPQSTFLPNYSLLKEVSSPEGTKIYTYKNPNFSRSDYSAAIVDPVLLAQTASKGSVSDQQIEKARNVINTGLQQIVSQKLKITNEPGPGVLRLQTAITGASLESEGFKPRNLIPISAAIKLASMATGNESKKPALVVELKFTDSQTGVLLKEVVTTIDGEKLSKQADISDSFGQLATTWVQEALKYSH